MKNYEKFLTILLILLVVALIVFAGFASYNWYLNYKADKDALELMNQFSNIQTDVEDENNENTNTEIPIEEPADENQTNTGSSGSTGSSSGGSTSYNLGTYYKNKYKVIGIISIPKLNIEYPIFNFDNDDTLRVGVAAIYPVDVEKSLNNVGNTVIAGHNYRNSRMFSKINTLSNGDIIYITDISGTRLEYRVYNNYTAEDVDFTYATRETNGGIEISLTTCTRDASKRTIIWAKVG